MSPRLVPRLPIYQASGQRIARPRVHRLGRRVLKQSRRASTLQPAAASALRFRQPLSCLLWRAPEGAEISPSRTMRVNLWFQRGPRGRRRCIALPWRCGKAPPVRLDPAECGPRRDSSTVDPRDPCSNRRIEPAVHHPRRSPHRREGTAPLAVQVQPTRPHEQGARIRWVNHDQGKHLRPGASSRSPAPPAHHRRLEHRQPVASARGETSAPRGNAEFFVSWLSIVNPPVRGLIPLRECCRRS